MKKILKIIFIPVIFFGLFGITKNSEAAPSISGVSGNVMHGSNVTVSGSGFGSGGTTPLLWEDFETGINGASLSLNPQVGTWTIINSGPKYTTETAHAGNNSATSVYSSGGGFANIRWEPMSHSSGEKYYQSYWFKYNSPNGSGQTKLTQVWGSWRKNDYNPGVMTGGLSGDWWATYIALENSGSYQIENYSVMPSRNQWHQFEMFLKQSDANIANGRVTIRIDGQAIYDKNPVKTREIESEGWDFTTFFDGMTNWNSPTQTWVDNIYFSDSWAHVELGDFVTYVASTIHEIQIPTAWSQNSITISANQGAFQSGQQVYLYVVDSNGEVNPNGYPVVIGNGGDTTPPGAPANLTVR